DIVEHGQLVVVVDHAVDAVAGVIVAGLVGGTGAPRRAERGCRRRPGGGFAPLLRGHGLGNFIVPGRHGGIVVVLVVLVVLEAFVEVRALAAQVAGEGIGRLGRGGAL